MGILMNPKHVASYTNGEVEISIYTFQNPLRTTYWVKAGVAVIEFPEEEWDNFVELMRAYIDEEDKLFRRKKTTNFLKRLLRKVT